jgi:hypothetical protein
VRQGRSFLDQQAWLHSAFVDLPLILGPSFLATIGVLLFHDAFDQTTELPLWAWVSIILCIDVAHVYSTLFRTYLNPTGFRENSTLLTVVPFLCWLGGVLLYSISADLFWRLLAYIAVFHFVRQQYGFMLLYSRNESTRSFKWIDRALIYLATLYPVIYWHTHLPRNFHWFVDGDFWEALPPVAEWITLTLYLVLILLYAIKETFNFCKYRQFSLPKQLLVVGTAISWYVGIVLLNGDMAFTITNVASHGIPYISLIWIFGSKQARAEPEGSLVAGIKFRQIFSRNKIPIFILSLLLLAYIEEGLWNGFVWREHLTVFSPFTDFPKIEDSATLAWIIPLLSVPQLTHYVLDGFIWKLRDTNANWQQVVFYRENTSL